MNSKDLYNAIGKVDDDILEESETAAHVRKTKNRWLKSGAMAACLCLVIAGAVIWKQIQSSHADEPKAANAENTWTTVSENGVTIPPMDVSLSANETADMIGFFIYQGRHYVQYEWIYDDVDIIGEHLGTATGLIDEWTPKDGYVEFAGSVRGDFYAVKGYDPAFILCIKQSTGAVCTYICNNGITLKYGSELYEDWLHLSGNFGSVQYESRASWYFSQGERYQMNGINDIVLDFIAGLDAAQFVPSDTVPLEDGQDHITDTELYHLYFQMENGMTVHLRLHENGYVRFQGILDLCVQVPEKSYSALLELLDNRADSTAVEMPEATGPTLEDCRNDAELGRYVPTYTPEDIYLTYADIYYYLDDQTADEIGTRAIWLDYESLENPHYFYTVTITWANEYGQYGWTGPMTNAEDLSVELISEYFRTETAGGNPLPEGSLDIGVWYDDVSVVISAHGLDADTAYAILRSAQ